MYTVKKAISSTFRFSFLPFTDAKFCTTVKRKIAESPSARENRACIARRDIFPFQDVYFKQSVFSQQSSKFIGGKECVDALVITVSLSDVRFRTPFFPTEKSLTLTVRYFEC